MVFHRIVILNIEWIKTKELLVVVPEAWYIFIPRKAQYYKI
jgi:hypothetical protein